MLQGCGAAAVGYADDPRWAQYSLYSGTTHSAATQMRMASAEVACTK